MADVAGWLIDNRGGSWSKAKKALRRLQPTLSRLRGKKLATISSRAFWEISRQIHERGQAELYQRLLASVLSPESYRIMTAYHQWMPRWIWRYPESSTDLPRFKRTRDGPRVIATEKKFTLKAPKADWLTWPLIWPSRINDFDAQHALRWRARFEVLERIRRDPDCAERLDTFQSWMRKRALESRRQEIALYRIAEPFAEGADSGFVERDIDELSIVELREYVAASVRRERILLKREVGFRRVQQVSGIPIPNLPGSGFRKKR